MGCRNVLCICKLFMIYHLVPLQFLSSDLSAMSVLSELYKFIHITRCCCFIYKNVLQKTFCLDIMTRKGILN